MNKKKSGIISKADIVLLLIVLLVGGTGILLLRYIKEDGVYARVTVDGRETVSLKLDEDRQYTVNTPNGANVIMVENGQVYVSYADCPDKICSDHKPINSKGETIICLPHKLVIEIVD